jgi:pilus assembly protein Flp/PilA
MLITLDFVSAYVRSRFADQRGASLVEYALLLALIAIVCVAAVTLLGTQSAGSYSQVGSSLSGGS